MQRYYAADGSLIKHDKGNDDIRVVSSGNIKKFNSSYGDKQWGSDLRYHILSKSFQSSSKEAQVNVASNIYQTAIKSDIVLKEMKIANSRGGTTGAHNEGPGVFAIYPNARSNEEYINNNYYNQVNVWSHEEDHNQGLGGDPFTHFNIGVKQLSHWSYSKTTKGFKTYMEGVVTGYLNGQEDYLVGELFMNPKPKEVYKSRNFRHYHKQYKKNIKKYNKIYGKERKPFKTEPLLNK